MPRKSKFSRTTKSREIVLTDRDLQIIRYLYEFRFLNVDQLMKLTASTNRNSINRRLRLLFDAKYIDRPDSQQLVWKRDGAISMVYALGDRGAKLLAAEHQVPIAPKADWRKKNRNITPRFFMHDLAVSEFVISMMVACDEQEQVRFISPNELKALADPKIQHREKIYNWKTQIRWNDQFFEVHVEPDYVFGIEYLDRAKGKNRAFFFVEIDEGTMPIIRRSPRQTSFMRKMLSYAHTHQTGVAPNQFGMKNFRVLTVTSSAERAKNLQVAYESNLTRQAPAGMFLFGHKKQLENDTALSMKWINGKAVPVFLFA